MQYMKQQIIDELEAHGGFTVSTGTLRAQDLLPVFLTLVGILDPARQRPLYDEFPEAARTDESHPWWDTEECCELLNNDVFDALNEAAPEGYWFGASDGDGACFGFWALEEED